MVTNEFVAVCSGEKDISKTADDVSSRTTNLQDQRRFGVISLYAALNLQSTLPVLLKFKEHVSFGK